MSAILRVLGATLPPRDPMDDRWYGLSAAASIAGVPVDAETALKISTVWACRCLLADTIASLPLMIFRYIGEDGRERARSHPLYSVLHDQANRTQTAFDFREMMTGHLLMSGDAIAIKIPGPRGPVDQLDPVHPDRIPPGSIEKLPGGRLRYMIKQDDGTRRAYNQEDIFHLRGPCKDGICGMSVIEYARDSFGLTLAAERYGGRFFRNDSRPGGVLETEGTLSQKAAERLKAGWEAAHTFGNQNRVAVLEEGLKWRATSITPEEAQFLGTREFQAEDVCRWFRVPPHMVGLTSKATTWGSGIEEMSLGFVTYTLLPWLTRWKQAIARDLIIATDTYFADFIVEGLLRGDIGSRYNAYAIGRQWGWLSANDVRRLENMNPIPDGGDAYLAPLNMGEAGSEPPPVAPGGGASAEHYRLLAEEAAGRVVRKEITAMGKAAARAGDDREAWEAAVKEFYSDHAAFVAQVMRVDADLARAYVNNQEHLLLSHGPAAMKDWQPRRVNDLVELATGEERWPTN